MNPSFVTFYRGEDHSYLSDMPNLIQLTPGPFTWGQDKYRVNTAANLLEWRLRVLRYDGYTVGLYSGEGFRASLDLHRRTVVEWLRLLPAEGGVIPLLDFDNWIIAVMGEGYGLFPLRMLLDENGDIPPMGKPLAPDDWPLYRPDYSVLDYLRTHYKDAR